MKQKSIILTLAAAALLPGITACHNDKKDGAASGAEAMPVDVAYPLVDSVVLHNTYPAYLSADKSVDLVARVDGYLVSQEYKDGTFVRKGDVLFRIEDGSYRDAVRQAEARLESAKATAAYATSHYEAVERALRSDAVSAMEAEQAKSSMNEAQAAVRNAQAALQQAQTTLSYCTVRAPFDGHVGMSTLTAGSYLAGSGQPVKLATIYDDALISVNFYIADEGYLELLKNRSAELGVDLENIPLSFGDSIPHSYTCNLTYMAPEIDRTTGTMKLQAKTKNTYGELRSGMYATVSLPYGIDREAILVRDASIGTDQRGKYVYVVNDSSKVVYTPVETGELVNDTLRIITSGLTPKDRYVTKALLKVRDGSAVKPNLVK
ncbi:MAG: efflux RND transporter periplasmic adaptor subunit [Muribaculaceae bacterium]|nr:efflux RND transporter periplasmic adaptor subunit [Muribaculaceae bacterium]